MVYNSYLFNIFQFIVIHTVKGFSLVNEAGRGVSLESSYSFYDPTDVDNWSLISVPFLNPLVYMEVLSS